MKQYCLYWEDEGRIYGSLSNLLNTLLMKNKDLQILRDKFHSPFMLKSNNYGYGVYIKFCGRWVFLISLHETCENYNSKEVI